MYIGIKLGKILSDRNITPYRIAMDTGISPSSIANYINGSTKPDHSKLLQVCAYLGISVDEFLKDVDGVPKLKYASTVNPEHVKEKRSSYQSTATPLTQFDFLQVPYIPIHAQAGYARGYGDMEYIENMPRIPFITDKTFRGKLKIAGEDKTEIEYLLDQVDFLLYEVSGHPTPFQMLLDCCEN